MSDNKEQKNEKQEEKKKITFKQIGDSKNEEEVGSKNNYDEIDESAYEEGVELGPDGKPIIKKQKKPIQVKQVLIMLLIGVIAITATFFINEAFKERNEKNKEQLTKLEEGLNQNKDKVNEIKKDLLDIENEATLGDTEPFDTSSQEELKAQILDKVKDSYVTFGENIYYYMPDLKFYEREMMYIRHLDDKRIRSEYRQIDLSAEEVDPEVFMEENLFPINDPPVPINELGAARIFDEDFIFIQSSDFNDLNGYVYARKGSKFAQRMPIKDMVQNENMSAMLLFDEDFRMAHLLDSELLGRDQLVPASEKKDFVDFSEMNSTKSHILLITHNEVLLNTYILYEHPDYGIMIKNFLADGDPMVNDKPLKLTDTYLGGLTRTPQPK